MRNKSLLAFYKMPKARKEYRYLIISKYLMVVALADHLMPELLLRRYDNEEERDAEQKEQDELNSAIITRLEKACYPGELSSARSRLVLELWPENANHVMDEIIERRADEAATALGEEIEENIAGRILIRQNPNWRMQL